MKERVVKCQETKKSLSKHIEYIKANIFDQKMKAKEFNSFFTNIEPECASKILNLPLTFVLNMTSSTTSLQERDLKNEELKSAQATNKSAGYNGINFNVAKNIFGRLLKNTSLILH